MIDADDLLQELEESIPQGRANSTHYSAGEAEDPFAELNDLLEASVSEVQQKEQYAADLKARKRNFAGMTKEEVDYCNSRMAAFEQLRIWRPVQNIAVFTRFKCQCGEEKLVFTRFMQEQRSRTNATARRWDTVTEQNLKLPTIAAEELRTTAICCVCAVLMDIDTHNARPLQEVLK